MGSGSFGTVYRCEDERTGRELVVKVPNAVEGASQLQNAEAYLNRRVARAPWVASGCAKFLGTYYEVEGARSPCLVWAYEEGEATLEDFLEDRRFPESLEDALRVRARANEAMRDSGKARMRTYANAATGRYKREFLRGY